jgi:hypothetical protein
MLLRRVVFPDFWEPCLHPLRSREMTPNKAHSDRIFPVALLAITIVVAVGGGAVYWYHTSQGYQLGIQPSPSNVERQERVQSRPDFETVYTELGIQPLPSNVERQERVQSRLAQLSRELCYRDAVVNLARALLNAGYPREAATSLRSFVKRCGSAPEVLPLAFTGLERINDFSGALEVANELALLWQIFRVHGIPKSLFL